MSREIKEKPRGAKGTGRKPHVVPTEFMRRRLLSGKERAKERIRDTEPAQDNTEDYGSEQIEGGVQGGTVLAGRGVEAIGGAAWRGKAKDGEAARRSTAPPGARKTRPGRGASNRAAELGKSKAIRDAQETIRSARAAERMARQTARTAERDSAAASRSIKDAIRLAVKPLRDTLAMLAAGGGPALAVVLVLCMAALLLATPFGIFFASEPNDTGESIQTAVTSLNGEFCLVIEQIIEGNPHDELEMDNDGVAAMLGNWNDVLAVYAVRITTDGASPHDAVTMTPEKLDMLRGVFCEMNRIDYHLDTATDTETEESTVILTIDVTVRSKNEMSTEYGFTAEQLSLLAELTQPEYTGLPVKTTSEKNIVNIGVLS